MHLMACERVSGSPTLGNHSTVELFNCNSICGEHRALIGSSEGKDRRAFLVQPDSHTTGSRILRNTLKAKEATTAHNRSFDPLMEAPPIESAAGFYDSIEKFVHLQYPSAS
jgi:hypothetical protein